MSGLLRYTVLSDGSSDRALLYPIRWALMEMAVPVESAQWADLRILPSPPPVSDLAACAKRALELYPAELLLIHRDAEVASLEERVEEIRKKVSDVIEHYVAIVPVRMTEAWLLHDESAIRCASDNPNGKVGLSLPKPKRVEQESDPKETLKTALCVASEYQGRRLKKLRQEFGIRRARTAELIQDFSPLCGVPSFKAFLSALEAALKRLGHL
ncbi:MAG: DUF4276 family protein [Myxococcales bacterium]|jgi:hypothetical protein|nr:DUF4276 family protein [Myxococcales bacterium]